MRKSKFAHKVCIAILILTLALSLIQLSSFAASTNNSEDENTSAQTGVGTIVRPIVYHANDIDKDFDGVQDSLENMISQVITVNKSDVIPVIITLYNPVTSQDLDYFKIFGGRVTHVYEYVTYGFAGVIPAANISRFASLEGTNLCIVESDRPIRYHLDVGVPLIRVRPIVWNTYGYTGSTDHSIAIIDTGIDDSHPDVGPFGNLDFSKKLVGWYDASGDNTLTPQDYGEHGTHVAAIAAGTGVANGLQGSGNVQTTFTYRLPGAGSGYADYFDVLNPGTIALSVTWDGSNKVALRLDNPAGLPVKEVSGTSQPLTLTYNTVGTSYPTGRYRVVVFNLAGPSGVSFSCVKTYPYQGLSDGYNLFTGVAPNSKLVGVKVFNNAGSGTSSTIMAGMDWVIQNRVAYGITVASMSLSLKNGAVDSTLDQKADTMVKYGIVTTVSAGNNYPTYTIGSPGTAAYVMTVAATNEQNGLTDYSSNGNPAKNEYGLIKPDVAAPGGTFNPQYGNLIVSADSNDVDYGYSGYADQNPNDYQHMGGTSMSAPHVAGLASLIVQALGGWHWTLDEALKVKMLICMTSFEVQSGEGTNQPLLNRGDKDNKEGYGRVCADAAVEAATMSYNVGDVATSTLGSGPSDKKVWARQVSLSAKTRYEFHLAMPSDADYDLYLYNGTSDGYGQPIIMKKSVSTSKGVEEIVQFTPTVSGVYYIVVKQVSGSGPFNLQSTSTPERDVAVVSVAPSFSKVYVGWVVFVTVVVKNNGGTNETFNVTTYYDDNAIGTQTVTNLIVDAERELAFNWDTTDVAPNFSYTIKAEASVVPNETSISDNTFIDGEVKVKVPGDVDDDGDVDIADVSLIARAFGTDPRWPPGTDWYQWNPEADINNDFKVDIWDLDITVVNYGRVEK